MFPPLAPILRSITGGPTLSRAAPLNSLLTHKPITLYVFHKLYCENGLEKLMFATNTLVLAMESNGMWLKLFLFLVLLYTSASAVNTEQHGNRLTLDR